MKTVNKQEKVNTLLSSHQARIESSEDHLFGLTLYYDTMPSIMKWTNTRSINRIIRRTQKNIDEAKKIFAIVEKDGSRSSLIENFNWIQRPTFMNDKIELVCSLYESLYPKRHNERLSKEEAKNFRQALMHSL